MYVYVQTLVSNKSVVYKIREAEQTQNNNKNGFAVCLQGSDFQLSDCM